MSCRSDRDAVRLDAARLLESVRDTDQGLSALEAAEIVQAIMLTQISELLDVMIARNTEERARYRP